MMYYPKTREEWLALRHKYISSTEVAALFGRSPYLTAFELAVMKKKAEPDPDFEQSERMTWGIRLQNAIARGVGKDYGVQVRALNAYCTHGMGHARAGASFDYELVGLESTDGFSGDTVLREMYEKHGPGVLEIKTVDSLVFRNEWKTEAGIEPPVHIELQMQHQLACIARKWGAFGVLVGGNRLEVLIRERDHQINKRIVKKCEEFWVNLDKGIMPPVTLPADVEAIRQLYNYAEPGKVLDAGGDNDVLELCAKYATHSQAESAAKKLKDSVKAELLMKIGEAEKVFAGEFTISAGLIGPCEIEAYTRQGYRNFKITRKKAKAHGKGVSGQTDAGGQAERGDARDGAVPGEGEGPGERAQDGA